MIDVLPKIQYEGGRRPCERASDGGQWQECMALSSVSFVRRPSELGGLIKSFW